MGDFDLCVFTNFQPNYKMWYHRKDVWGNWSICGMPVLLKALYEGISTQ